MILDNSIKISDITRTLLENRGIKTDAQIFDYFYQDIYNLSNPFEIKNIYSFIDRIKEAISQNERILIYGDKDADGVTSAATLYTTLKKLTNNVEAFVPNLEVGYGLSKDVLLEYAKSGISLVITVDCGISNVEEIAAMNEMGVDVIITDHHNIPSVLPEAYLIFNPKLEDSGFVSEGLPGCVVIFKLLEALVFSYSEKYFNKDFVVIDFKISNENILYLKAIRMRNFIPITEDIFAFEQVASGGYKSMIDDSLYDEISLIDMLEEFASFVFENEDTYIVCTGGLSRVDKLFEYFDKCEVFRPPYKAVFDLLSLGAKYANVDVKSVKSLLEFSYKCGVNIFKYEDSKFSDILIRCTLFNRLFMISQGNIVKYIESKLPLLTLGVIADVASVTYENRTIVREGLRVLAETSSRDDNIGVIAKKLNIDLSKITCRDIGWKLSPFINSAGRMGYPEVALKLLSSDDKDVSIDSADKVHEYNNLRKRLTDENFKFIEKIIQDDIDSFDGSKVIVVSSDNIEQGLTGLIASRVSSKYGKPSVVICENTESGECTGSARSSDNDDVREMVGSSEELLIKFGGHTNAAGFSLKREHFDEFKKNCEEYAHKTEFGGYDVFGKYDLKISVDNISLDLAKELEALEPYGPDNTEPLFLSKNINIVDYKVLDKGAKKHLMITLSQNGINISGMIWNVDDDNLDRFEAAYSIDAIYYIRVNRYNGTVEPRVYIENYEFCS